MSFSCGSSLKRCESIPNSCEFVCEEGSEPSQASSLTSSRSRSVGVREVQGRRVQRYIEGLTKAQSQKIYKDILPILKANSRRDTVSTVPIRRETGRMQFRDVAYVQYKEETSVIKGKEEDNDEECLSRLNNKYLGLKREKPNASFNVLIKDLRKWALSLPLRQL